MDPQQPPAQTQFPTNYLDQIAPQAPKRRLLRPGLPLVIALGVALVLVVIVISVVANVLTTSQRTPLQHLSARFTATEKVVADAQSDLQSSQLRSLNSTLKLYLTNTIRDIAAPLDSAGVDVAKLPESIVAEESTDDITARLEDARLNAKFDRIYAQEIATQLETILITMKQIYDSTGNTQLKSFLESAYQNLEPTQKAFAEFNAANG